MTAVSIDLVWFQSHDAFPFLDKVIIFNTAAIVYRIAFYQKGFGGQNFYPPARVTMFCKGLSFVIQFFKKFSVDIGRPAFGLAAVLKRAGFALFGGQGHGVSRFRAGHFNFDFFFHDKTTLTIS
jgi:hypothetical protein